MPDQMCQSRCSSSADHQLNAIRATSAQWNKRVETSQTGCLGGGTEAGAPAGSVMFLFFGAVRVVARLAGFAEIGVRSLDRGHVAAWGRRVEPLRYAQTLEPSRRSSGFSRSLAWPASAHVQTGAGGNQPFTGGRAGRSWRRFADLARSDCRP